MTIKEESKQLLNEVSTVRKKVEQFQEKVTTEENKSSANSAVTSLMDTEEYLEEMDEEGSEVSETTPQEQTTGDSESETKSITQREDNSSSI